jgi:chromate transport protein ChrA
MKSAPNGWIGGLICLAAIYLPSFLLLLGALPYWDALRHRTAVQSALKGVNATVVGILLGALYTPVWTVRFSPRRISGWEFSRFCYWCFGKRRLGWSLSSER